MLHGKFTSRSRALLTAVIVGIGTAGLAVAPPATAELHLEQYIEVPQCEPATGQRCPQTPEVRFTAGEGDKLQATFTGNANGCSDALIRFNVDGYPQSDWLRVGPNQTVASDYFNRSGDHVLSVSAEGIEGGCNTGILNSWGGTVRIDSILEVGPAPRPVIDEVGPAPRHVPPPCKWGYTGPVVLRLDNGQRVELDQWNGLNALGPARYYTQGDGILGTGGLFDKADILSGMHLRGVVSGANGEGTQARFAIVWYDDRGGRLDGGDFTGDIDPGSGIMRGTVENDAGARNGWVADQRWACL
jgi:hypothetical protein